MAHDQQNSLLCEVEWNKRFDGSLPKNSDVSSEYLKKNYPLILLDYYESKLVINKK